MPFFNVNNIYKKLQKNMKNNKYQEEFSNFISIMNEALKRNDFAVYDAAKEMLEEAIDDCKKERALMNELKTTNFGKLNHIFEEALPELLKTNKKAVRNVIKTIKEDKNLLGEFNFYHLIKNYNSKIDESTTPEEMLAVIEEMVSKNINRKTIEESNKKLMNVMIKSGVKPLSHIDEKNNKLYESGAVILSKEPKLTNLYKLHENRKAVADYMETNKDRVVKEEVDAQKLISDFEKNMREKLTESEVSFVQQITDFRSPIAEKRKEKLFNKLKEDCVAAVNSMLKENDDNPQIKSLGKQLDELKFSNESIVKDIAKLLEIRDILMDN